MDLHRSKTDNDTSSLTSWRSDEAKGHTSFLHKLALQNLEDNLKYNQNISAFPHLLPPVEKHVLIRVATVGTSFLSFA